MFCEGVLPLPDRICSCAVRWKVTFREADTSTCFDALQIVSQRAMADVTGAAARALAFSLFSKVTRRQTLVRPSRGSAASQSTGGGGAADVPEVLSPSIHHVYTHCGQLSATHQCSCCVT